MQLELRCHLPARSCDLRVLVNLSRDSFAVVPRTARSFGRVVGDGGALPGESEQRNRTQRCRCPENEFPIFCTAACLLALAPVHAFEEVCHTDSLVRITTYLVAT